MGVPSTQLDQDRLSEVRMLRRMIKDLAWAEGRYPAETEPDKSVRQGFALCRRQLETQTEMLENLEPRAIRIGQADERTR